MKDFLGLGLLAVGGWALYEWLMGSASLAQASAPNPTGTTANTTINTTTGSTSGNQAGANNQPTSNNAMLAIAMLKAAGLTSSGMLNVDQWNYYYGQVTGLVPQDLSIATEDRSTLMSINDYFVRRASFGLSGLGLGRVYVSGMGRIGAGYGINQNRINSDASAYELANKRFM